MPSQKQIKQLSDAIRQAQVQIQWRPGSATRHLHKRKLRRHLPIEANIIDYDRIIQNVLRMLDAVVYVYHHEGKMYPTIVGDFEGQKWLVMVSATGVMESACVVENPKRYLTPPEFEQIGLLQEVLR